MTFIVGVKSYIEVSSETSDMHVSLQNGETTLLRTSQAGKVECL